MADNVIRNIARKALTINVYNSTSVDCRQGMLLGLGYTILYGLEERQIPHFCHAQRNYSALGSKSLSSSCTLQAKVALYTKSLYTVLSVSFRLRSGRYAIYAQKVSLGNSLIYRTTIMLCLGRVQYKNVNSDYI
jgi:hypothetical protein